MGALLLHYLIHPSLEILDTPPNADKFTDEWMNNIIIDFTAFMSCQTNITHIIYYIWLTVLKKNRTR